MKILSIKRYYVCLLLIGATTTNAQITGPINISRPKHRTDNSNNPTLLPQDSTSVEFYWFPARNKVEAAKIWSNGSRWNFLNTASISGTKNGGTASVDVLSDYLGAMRVALVGNVSASSKDSTNEQKVERFFSGGGNAVLVGNLIGPSIMWGTSGYLMSSFVPKIGFDFPAIGTTTSTATASADLGIELRANLPLANNKMGFFGDFRGSYTFGGKEFYSQLKTSQNPFAYGIAHVGITFPDLNIAVLYTRLLFGPSSMDAYNGNGRLSLVVSPNH